MQKRLIGCEWPDGDIEQLIPRSIIRADVVNHAMRVQVLEELFARFDKLARIAEHSPM
jgi:hypothetical protein